MNDAHLLSSYLQVLIMSEGDAWLLKAVYEVSLLLRNTASTPVSDAEQMVRRFCTKELRGVRGGVGDVEEYIANAALDLVIMATWSLAAGQMDVETLSVSWPEGGSTGKACAAVGRFDRMYQDVGGGSYDRVRRVGRDGQRWAG